MPGGALGDAPSILAPLPASHATSKTLLNGTQTWASVTSARIATAAPLCVPPSQPVLGEGFGRLHSSGSHLDEKIDANNEKGTLLSLKAWVNPVAILLPQPSQLGCVIRNVWEQGRIGSASDQKMDVLSRVEKWLGKIILINFSR